MTTNDRQTVQAEAQVPPPPHAASDLTIRQAFARFWPMTRGDRRWFVLICVCVIVAAVCETAAILLFSNLTDNALQQGSLAAFWSTRGPVAGRRGPRRGDRLPRQLARRLDRASASSCGCGPASSGTSRICRPTSSSGIARATWSSGSPETSRPSRRWSCPAVVGTVSALFRIVLFSAAAVWLRWDLALATFVLAPLLWLTAKIFSGPIKSVARRGAGRRRSDHVGGRGVARQRSS